MAVLQKKKNSLKSKLRTVAKSSSNSKKKFNKTRKTGSKTRKMRGGAPKIFHTLPRSVGRRRSSIKYTVQLPKDMTGIRAPNNPVSRTEADVQQKLLDAYKGLIKNQDPDAAKAYDNKMFELWAERQKTSEMGGTPKSSKDVHEEAALAKQMFAQQKLQAVTNSLITYGYRFS